MYQLTFTQEHLNILNMALGELQLKIVGPLVAEINRQIQEQAKPAVAEEPAAP